MMPRHPSVPNFTTVVSAICCQSFLVRAFPLLCPAFRLSCWKTSDQILTPSGSQFANHLAYILRSIARGDEQRVVRFDDDQVVDAQQSDGLAGSVDIVARGIDGNGPVIGTVCDIRGIALRRFG